MGGRREVLLFRYCYLNRPESREGIVQLNWFVCFNKFLLISYVCYFQGLKGRKNCQPFCSYLHQAWIRGERRDERSETRFAKLTMVAARAFRWDKRGKFELFCTPLDLVRANFLE